ncbi:UDP-N-acetylglucosamine--peptide N-acetylglucosaminyltransferase 110 kDa subunit isoform X1 [Triticum aestivum]|uniref:UDP-N-acetylglucosamine--peptide N-acetylglucosaminyltransferase 110 kDa subunit isoform X1 n=1 Tax=Triticum aestivum TaxID=4565 RepID=UPI001D00BAD1|nr:UDP-N-acetylglucosamine--peptide N-acetylglucosaminyltransferase 110 kDa subunit-like isoform X1 [Triticum aestivum]
MLEAQPPPPSRAMMLADLNVDPPESDGEDHPPTPKPNPAIAAAAVAAAAAAPVVPVDSSTRSCNEEGSLAKNTTVVKEPDTVECEDVEQHCPGASVSREEKVSNLKAALVNVARKMPKNAHAHFMLGLMYQRLGQPQKAIIAYDKSSEILLQDEQEVRRPDLLSSVRIHHAQCILQASMGDSFDEELDTSELSEILVKLKSSVELDPRQAAVWNILGLVLLRGGQLQSAISVFSTLTTVAPDYLDSLANLGVAYIQRCELEITIPIFLCFTLLIYLSIFSGDLELSTKCFQELVLKDQSHPAALVNYGALLLCKYGSLAAGASGTVSAGSYLHQKEALVAAKECLLAAVRSDPKAASIWVNLANAYYMAGEHRNSKRCLEQAAKFEPNHMPARYAIAVHRIRDAVRLQCSDDQLIWAANEMATVLKEGDTSVVDLPVAWAGLAMAHRAQHEIAAAYDGEQTILNEAEERALYTLKQAIQEDPDDAVQWHQLGLYNMCTTQFSRSVNFLKAAIARSPECCYAWSNLGIALQLSNDPSSETVYKRALVLSSSQQSYAILSNIGILYRQHRLYELARKMLSRSLEICPGYAPANNNLGLVFVAEGRWEDAVSCFEKAVKSDDLLDAAKSNLAKALALAKKQ